LAEQIRSADHPRENWKDKKKECPERAEDTAEKIASS
jgi:hypothetical protein